MENLASQVSIELLSPTCATFTQYTPTSGELKIAEVASRFTDVQQFQSLVEAFGFRHKSTVCTFYTFPGANLSSLNAG